jgi:hypothetical protein
MRKKKRLSQAASWVSQSHHRGFIAYETLTASWLRLLSHSVTAELKEDAAVIEVTYRRKNCERASFT